MHQLPSELCSQIYELACTDGGQTGHSLALVSKYINATSKPYRLQSVHVTGARRICALAKRLEEMEKEEGGMGRGIWYLRIELKGHDYHQETWPAPEPTQSFPSTLPKILPPIFRKLISSKPSTRTTPTMDPPRHEFLVTCAFFQILTLAAPTLQYLNFTLSPAPHEMVYERCYQMPSSFPVLRTLIPNYDDHRWDIFDHNNTPLRSLFFQTPSLEVLDLTGYSANDRGRQYTTICRLAPVLRELRIPLPASHGLGEALQSQTLPPTLQSISILSEEDPCQHNGYGPERCVFCCIRGISSQLIQAVRDLAAVDDRVRLEGDCWENIGV